MKNWASYRDIGEGAKPNVIRDFLKALLHVPTKKRNVVLSAIDSNTGEIENRTFPLDSEQAVEWAVAQNQRERNIYWLVNVPNKFIDKKPSKNEIAGMAWVHVDVDLPDSVDITDEVQFSQYIQKVHDRLISDNTPPSMLLFSGNGLQAFWRLAKIEKATGRPEKLEELNIGANKQFGGDHCYNIDRIMRVPGTVNWPNAKKKSKGRVPILADLLLWEPERTYAIGNFLEWVDANDPQPEETQDEENVLQGVPSIKHLEKDCISEITTDVDVPEDFYERIKRNRVKDKVLIARYRGNVKGLSDGTRSGIELSLVSLLYDDYSPSQIWAILHSRPEQFGNKLAELDKTNRKTAIRHLARMIATVRQERLVAEKRRDNVYEELEKLSKELVFVQDQDSFAYLDSRNLVKRTALNTTYVHISNELSTPKKKCTVVGLLEEMNQFQVVSGLTFYPGHAPIVYDEESCPNSKFPQLNLWLPRTIQPEEGDVSVFLEHMENLFPNEDDRNHVISFLAYMYQNPGKKIRHALLIVGRQGSGKSYIGNLMRDLLGYHNVSMANTSDIKSENNGFMANAEFVVVEEIMAPGKREITNKLKDLITEETISVREKYVKTYKYRNRSNFMFLTNYEDALYIDNEDRRYFVVSSNFLGDYQYYTRLWAPMNLYRETGNAIGLRALAHFFNTWDWRAAGFLPEMAPRLTQAKSLMINESRTRHERIIEEAIADGVFPFDTAFVSVKDIHEWLLAKNVDISRQKVSKTMEDLHLEKFYVDTRSSQYAGDHRSKRMTHFVIDPKHPSIQEIRKSLTGDTVPGKILDELLKDAREADNVVPLRK